MASINYEKVQISFDTHMVYLPDATASEIINEVKFAQKNGSFLYGISCVDGEFNIYNDNVIAVRLY
jgi:hypothetical protein